MHESFEPRWRRVGPNAYVPADVDACRPEQGVLEASVHLGGRGAVTGWAALRLARGAFFDGLEPDGRTLVPLPLAIGPHRQLRRDANVDVSRDPIDGHGSFVTHGVRRLEPRRALFDEMRRPKDWRESVVAIDMAAAARLVPLAQMDAFIDLHERWRRSRQARWALGLASNRSRSPMETRLRLVWQLDAGLPCPLVNQPVFDLEGRLIGIADLFDPVAGVVGEYDGADHRGAGRHTKDVRREDRFRRAGLEYFKVTALDMPDRAHVADRMLATRARAKFEDPDRCRWTLGPGRHTV